MLGKTNAGKTLLTLRLAEMFGLRRISLSFVEPSQASYCYTYSCHEAKKHLVSSTCHHTKSLQKIPVRVPLGKGSIGCELVDTPGLTAGIHPTLQIRQGMVQTLTQLKTASLILHILDVASLPRSIPLRESSPFDFQLMRFGVLRAGYVLLGNKIDVVPREEMLIRSFLTEEVQGVRVFLVSALTRFGLTEVHRYICYYLR